MSVLGEQEAGHLRAGLLGYGDGLNEGADNERQRLAELLGTRAGTLALLGSSKEEDLAALREIQAAVTGRIVEIMETPAHDTVGSDSGEITGAEKE